MKSPLCWNLRSVLCVVGWALWLVFLRPPPQTPGGSRCCFRSRGAEVGVTPPIDISGVE